MLTCLTDTKVDNMIVHRAALSFGFTQACLRLLVQQDHGFVSLLMHLQTQLMLTTSCSL